mgnify:CR=1 FL=1
MKKRKYFYRLCFGDGKWAKGAYVVEAYSEEQAEQILVEEVGKKLYKALPSLDIEYSWELKEVI